MNEKIKQIKNTVIPIGPIENAKVASLFFKYIMPICFSRGEDVSGFSELAPPFIKEQPHIMNFDTMTHALMKSGLVAAIYEAGYKDIIEEQDEILGMDSTAHFIHGAGYVPKEGFEDAVGFALLEMLENNTPIPSPEFWVEGAFLDHSNVLPIREVLFDHNFKSAKSTVYGCDLLGGTDIETNSVLVTLSNVPWINLSDAKWEQIYEFRKDEDSLKKFRNFRLFVSEKYVKKSSQYIQDDFIKRIEDFERARNKHGFDLQNSTIKTVINSKYIIGGGLSGMFAWLFGSGESSQVIGSSALLAGVSVQLANTLLDIRAANFTLTNRIEADELAYVIKARDNLSNDIT